jgi:hemerythrin
MLEDEEGPTAAFVEAVKKNVVDWVFNHIKSFDCSVATYLHMHAHPERI